MKATLSSCLSSSALSAQSMAVPRIGSRAQMAGYPAAQGSTTTRLSNWIGTNPNQPISLIQATGMQFSAEEMAKSGGAGWTYLLVRSNYCEPVMYKANTGDDELNILVQAYLSAQFAHMGVDCSMFDAVLRTCHFEMPIRGDAGLIFHRDAFGNIRLMEFSADMLGEPFMFINPRLCSLKVVSDKVGRLAIFEIPGNDTVYYAGRYFIGCDCVAYKIYERNASAWWSNPVIYSADDVIYVKDPRNFRSIRGVTMLAQVLQYMQKSENLLQSALSIAQRQALTFGRVFNNSGQPNGAAAYECNGFTWDDAVQTFFEKTPGGPLEEYRFNGDSAEFTNPTAPGAPVIEGIRKADEKVFTGLGMTYGFCMAYDGLGGAPSRLDVNRNTKEIERIINRIVKPVLMRITRETIRDAVRKGILPPIAADENGKGGIYDGDWMFTTLPIADAYKDSIEDIKAVRAGQDSISRVVARYNVTFPEIMRDRKDETVTAYRMLSEAKKELQADGIEDMPTIADFVQTSDNPQQAQQATDLAQGKPTTITDTNAKGQMSVARLADVSDEARDNDGEWTSGGGSSGNKKVASGNPPTKSPAATKVSHSCNDRCKRARESHIMVDKSIQRYAEEYNEPRVAKALGGVSFPNSEPIDIAIAADDGKVKHGIELKTVVNNANAKITMKGDAIARKRSWERKNKAQVHTVVVDDSEVMNANGDGKHDESRRKIYYRRGYGSFRIQNMHQVKDFAELKTLLDTPKRQLPEGAK